MAQSQKILVVDDEVGITAVIKISLESEGFTVHVFNEPKEALDTFKAGYYDLLITDIRMPVMTGLDLYREIKKIDTKIRVVFITAFENYENETLKTFLKMKGTLIKKPFEVADLVSHVRKELNTTLNV